MEKEFRIDGLMVSFSSYLEAEKFIKAYNKKYINLITEDKIEMLTTNDIKTFYWFESAEEAMKWGASPDWWEV